MIYGAAKSVAQRRVQKSRSAIAAPRLRTSLGTSYEIGLISVGQ
jgi:hypothetical protein